MDTKTAQRQLISLITQHLSESIPVTRILTYKPDKNGSVTGRFESLGRVFNFAFNGMDVRYKPSGNMDSALFSEYYLQRFDAAPRGVRAIPKCTSKSYSCKGSKGVACIPLTNNCRMANTAIGNERLNKIKGLAKMLASSGEDTTKLEASQAKIVEQRLALVAENRAKRHPKKIEKVATKVEPIKEAKLKKEKVVKTKKETTKKEAQKPVEDKVKPIKDYDEFKVKALTAFRDLNEDYNYEGLVPIHRIREAVGKSVGKEDFDKYLKKLQGSGGIQLQSPINGFAVFTDSQIKDSYIDSFGSVKTAMSLTDKKLLNGLPKKEKEPSAISRKDFEKKLNKVYDAKSKEYDKLYPIDKLRKEFGDDVSRGDFKDWLLDLQKQGKFELVTGLIVDDSPEKRRDVIRTELGGLRYFIRKA